jgi:acetyl-CoA synthetase
MDNAIDTFYSQSLEYQASHRFLHSATITSSDLFLEAENDRDLFWENRAKELDWFSPWRSVLEWNRPYSSWFLGGKINASYNCLDVHLSTKRRHKTALLWEGEDETVKTYTYEELYTEVSKFAYHLIHTFNIKKGDRITLYMPMIPELMIAVLACARIGAIHSVVFGGFSAKSLRERIIDSGSSLVITADGGLRRGSLLPLKSIVDDALTDSPSHVRNVIVVKHRPTPLSLDPNRDHIYQEFMKDSKNMQSAIPMDSEDPLFILYTSGTTGKPKGIVHTTGGYLTHAKYSSRLVFDLNDTDIFFCTADIGWITGHTYVVYGPLSNGATCVMYEGAPDWPDKDRFWRIIHRHKVSILYTAPTAIRACMKWGDHYPAQHDLSSLRLLGTVGEPINPDAWEWYYSHVGGGQCPIVDTWWQTETGGIMISTIPALSPMKPGKAGRPLPGISADILDSHGHPLSSGGGYLSLTKPWPSMLRGVWGDDSRFNDVYWRKFDTYFAGDGATKDADGYFMILGRVDDVLNCSGHRIGTMEVESALVSHESVCEAAVVGIPDTIKGQRILAFVILQEGKTGTPSLKKELIRHVGQDIGSFAKPAAIIFSPDLPKTRSGKIMRRILKAIANNDPVGDTTTLANQAIVDGLIEKVNDALSIKNSLT